ncbi:MAG: DUF1501 domain-containing protein [Alphaproteobacteria bacterium]|nr:DUF1501 domain-containing protein [Alphaproteobacteria bacterium]
MFPSSRRRFLKTVAGLPLFALMPQGCATAPGEVAATPVRAAGFRGATGPTRGRTVIMIEMFGGNDGLNTVVPYKNPKYAALRPTIAIPVKNVIRIGDELGFHPALERAMTIWERGEMTTVLGVGYANPNRSHFRSQEIWETAANSEEVLTEGWLGRAMAEHPVFRDRRADADAVVIGSGSLGAVLGRGARVVTMNDPRQYVRDAQRLADISAATTTPALAHLLKTQGDALATATKLKSKIESRGRFEGNFPGHALGRNLANAVALLDAGVDAPIIKVTSGGFDTHGDQLGRHDNLLKQFADSVVALRDALKQIGRWDDTLVFAYSEFGRRVAENNSRGTDHGTAGVAFFLGGGVAGGLQGKQPSLDDLMDGDLKFNLDFRRLYATILANWWGQPENYLAALGHAPLPVFRAAVA